MSDNILLSTDLLRQVLTNQLEPPGPACSGVELLEMVGLPQWEQALRPENDKQVQKISFNDSDRTALQNNPLTCGVTGGACAASKASELVGISTEYGLNGAASLATTESWNK